MGKKRGLQPLPKSTLEALAKAAVAYRNSPRVQTSYSSKERYFNEKVGHLFRNASAKGYSTWKSRLYRARKILCGGPIPRSRKTQEDTLRDQFIRLFNKLIVATVQDDDKAPRQKRVTQTR